MTGGETPDETPLQFLILGPVELRASGRSLPLGGTKQRTVLAALVLRAGDTVAVERLIDDVWSERPPPSAAHTLEGYVSRLRRTLEPFGPTIERQGGGYRLELRGGFVDARRFESLVELAAGAAAAGDHERASALAAEGLRLWRGPALTGVSLPTEADRLEELRVRALEQRFDAELELSRHEAVVAELRAIVREHPHRERLVAQLMIALYRSGRHAEALAAYEATRRSLADELGLQPSANLQRLSGEIVRQEPALALEPATGTTPGSLLGTRRSWRLRAAVALGALIALAGAAAIALSSRDDEKGVAATTARTRVALLLYRAPTVGHRDPIPNDLVDGLRLAEHRYGLVTEILVLPEFKPGARPALRAAQRLRSGRFDLVVAAGGTIYSLQQVVHELSDTRFVSLDLDWPDELPANASSFVFDDGASGYLVGYLSGLIEAGAGPRLERHHIVSAIGAQRAPTVERMLDEFAKGVRRALPDVTVLRAYSGDWVEQSKCEAIANRHIDSGADIVFPAAGSCSFGALSAAKIRGVWGVGVDGDRSYLGAHILASAEKRFDQAVVLAVRSFLAGTLPAGGRVVLRLDDDAVGIAGLNPEVPATIRRRVELAAAALRRGEEP